MPSNKLFHEAIAEIDKIIAHYQAARAGLLALSGLPASQKAAEGRPRGRTYPPHCVAPKCTNEHRGPAHSFLCWDHSNKAGTKQAREWKAKLMRSLKVRSR